MAHRRNTKCSAADTVGIGSPPRPANFTVGGSVNVPAAVYQGNG